VAILDTGLSPTHLDLQGRIDYDLSRSFEPFDDQFIDFYFPGFYRSGLTSISTARMPAQR
jgi:hypothetical protein